MDTRERTVSNDAAIANVGAEMGRRRVTQKRLAQMLGMSQAAVSDRQRGHTPWSLAELDQVADLFGVTVADLLTDTNVSPFPGRVNDPDGTVTRRDTAGRPVTGKYGDIVTDYLLAA